MSGCGNVSFDLALNNLYYFISDLRLAEECMNIVGMFIL